MPLCFIEPQEAIRVVAESVGREARRQLLGEVVRAWVDEIPEDELARTVASLERARLALEERRAEALATRSAALRGHDPERTLERGYALLLNHDGEPLPTAAAARQAGRFDVRLADGSVGAQVIDTDMEEVPHGN